MENNILSKNYKIIFTEDKYPIIDELLKKYRLEELDEEALENLETENPVSPPSVIIINIVNGIIGGLISIGDAPKLLKNEVGISDKDAESLSRDIETRLLPICKKVTEENLATKNITTNNSGSEPIDETPKINRKKTDISRPIQSPKIIKEVEKRTDKTGSDKYREIVE